MKRTILAIIICAAIIACGVFADGVLKRTSDELQTKCSDLTAGVQNGLDIKNGIADLQAFWEKRARVLRIFVAHDRLTEIELVLAGIDAKESNRDREGLAEDLETAGNLITNLYRQEKVSVWNIL